MNESAKVMDNVSGKVLDDREVSFSKLVNSPRPENIINIPRAGGGLSAAFYNILNIVSIISVIIGRGPFKLLQVR